ncbi:MAG: transposase, partial [Clostridia bacterium]|nr:transposase [Clostridia bacterium]
MENENRLQVRKSTRLKEYDYSSPGAYFVTICTENRKEYFWQNNLDVEKFSWHLVGANCVRPKNLPLSHAGKIVMDELEMWNKTYKNVSIHSYVIMPNHVHIMVIILPDESGRPQVAPTLGRMVKQFKGAVTKKIGEPVWQKSFMEHIVRDKQDFEVRFKYIRENPLHW